MIASVARMIAVYREQANVRVIAVKPVNFTNASADTAIPSGGVAGKSSILPHESGHACNLWHVDPADLMQPSDPRAPDLSVWQTMLLRASRHVTYF